jgi:hypothetical protein
VKHTIRRFEPIPTARIIALLYGLIGVLLAPILFILGRMSPDGEGMGTVFIVLFPLLYAVIGFIGTLIATALYNLVAGWVGGIVVDLDAPGEIT